MDDPPFYRDDLQAYYDLRISSGNDEHEAVRELKKKFKIKSVTVTPTGEVRSPGIVDNPSPPEAPAAAPPEGEEPPPEGDEPGTNDGDPGSQMGGEDPHGKDPKKSPPPKKDEAGPELPGRCEIPDEVWREFLQADGDLDEFERWAIDTYPDRVVAEDFESWEAPDLFEHWRPRHLPKQRVRRDEAVRKLSAVRRDLYERFSRLVNMRTGELRAHLRSHELREMLASTRRSKRTQLIEGRRLARHVLHMKATAVEEWDDATWDKCRQIVSQIERARRNATPLLDERGAPTRKLFALRSLGHNPTVRAYVTESEIEHLLEDQRALHRYIDATPGLGLVELRAADDQDAPGTRVSGMNFDDLKKGKVDLDPAERDEVLKREATWHHNAKEPEKPTPAVWKARVGDKTHYVTNTHRLFQVRSTLAEAINAYHKVVKQTA